MSRPEYLDLIKNKKHREAVANDQVITGQELKLLPKIPENHRKIMCQLCSSNEVENEFHFLFECKIISQFKTAVFSTRTSQVLQIRRLDVGKKT